VWNDGLFAALITCILRQLVMEARFRREAGAHDPVFAPGEMLVFAGFALNRLKIPFQFLLNEVLCWEPALRRFGLQGSGLTPDMVSVRLANDSTGPTFIYGHVVRHPRYKDDVRNDWAPHDLQTGGDQAKDNIQYIMLTRSVKDCTLWLHSEPLGWPGNQLLLDKRAHCAAGSEPDPDHNLRENLKLHEKLVTLTAQYEHILLHVGHKERNGFQFAETDSCLGHDWWNIQVQWITSQVLRYYMTGEGKQQLHTLIMENFVKPIGGNLATTLSLLPQSKLVTVTLQDAKRARHRQETGPSAMPPPQLGQWAWPVDVQFALSTLGCDNLCSMVWALGARTVNCLTVRPSSEKYAVAAWPLLDPFPGLPQIPYTLNRDRNANEPADAITALVLLTWALWWEVHHRQADYTPLSLVTVHHKASLIESSGLEWWTRGCSCDRAALCLLSDADAANMHHAAAVKGPESRPPKPRTPRLYAYLGGGVDHNPDEVSSIVIRTRDPDLLVAVLAAARLAMATWPNGLVEDTLEEDMVDGDAMNTEEMNNSLLVDYAAYKPDATGEPARAIVRRVLHNAASGVSLPVAPPAPAPAPADASRIVQEVVLPDEAAVDELLQTAASALHRERGLTLTPVDFVPDWSANDDDDDDPELVPVPPATTQPSTMAGSSTDTFATATPAPATPAAKSMPRAARIHTAMPHVHFGVDLTGVRRALALHDITEDLALDNGPVPHVFDWMARLVAHIGSENVFIVSKVGRRGEKMWGSVLHKSGFYRVTGMQPQNVHWVRDRTGDGGKAPVVAWLKLTHFVDDRSDVLCDIREHFTNELAELPMPVLYLVPTTSWTDQGARADFKDIQRAKRESRSYNLTFASCLSEVPLPPCRLQPRGPNVS